MEVLIIFLALFTLGVFGFLIIEKPYAIVGILLFMFIYIVNIEIPGPLDARGLLMLVLFTRLVFFDRANLDFVIDILFKDFRFHILVGILIIYTTVSYVNEFTLDELLKTFILNIISLLLGFVIVMNKEGRNALIFSVILVGIVSSVDIILNYFITARFTGSLQIVRPLDQLTRTETVALNHNFPGFLSGIGFVYAYFLYIQKKMNKFFILILMFFLGAGIIFSTSRSTLLGVIVVSSITSFYYSGIHTSFIKVFGFIFSIIVLLISFYFIYNMASHSSSQTTFIDRLYYRIYEEPAEIFGAEESKSFTKWGESRVGSITFRINKLEQDINNFRKFSALEQFFGLGKDGYEKVGTKRYRGEFSSLLLAHNGYLMLMIEYGILGLILYLFISLNLIFKTFKLIKVDTPIALFFTMLLLYSIGQNSELTSSLAFLLFGTMIGNIYEYHENEELDDDEKSENENDEE